MSDATFLPDDTLDAIETVLRDRVLAAGVKVPVETIGAKDFDDDDNLVMQLPAVRLRYDSSGYQSRYNTGTVYDGEHQVQLWCAAEDLRGGSMQRQATLDLVRQVVNLLIGVRLKFADATQSDPVRILGIGSLPDDNIGTIYIISVAIAGSAVFPGGQ